MNNDLHLFPFSKLRTHFYICVYFPYYKHKHYTKRDQNKKNSSNRKHTQHRAFKDGKHWLNKQRIQNDNNENDDY